MTLLKHAAATHLLVALLGALGGYAIGRATPNADAVAATLGAALGAEEAGLGEAEGGEEDEFALVCTSALVIVLVLILLTIVFEEAKHAIGHAVDRAMAPIIESLFGELTVLGFLSLCTFLVTKTGYFEMLSVRIFGEAEEEELLELFEAAHFSLFGVMITFVLTVLMLVGDGARTEHEWLQLERESRDDAHVARCAARVAAHRDAPAGSLFSRARARLAAAFPSLAPEGRSSAIDLLRYHSLRREFVLERSVVHPFRPASGKNRVPDDFNFGRYLSICMGKVLAHSVHLGIGVWSGAAAFALFFFLVMKVVAFDPVFMAWAWAGTGVAMFFLANAFDRHMVEIMHAQAAFVLPSAGAKEDPESTPLVNGNGSKEGEDLPPWCFIDLDAYKKSHPCVIKAFTNRNVQPNRQDALHWFGRKGPEYNVLIFQASLLSTAIYCAVLFLTFLPLMYAQSSTGDFVLYLVVSSAPVLVSQRQRRNIAAHMTQANCVGTHRKPQSVNAVLAETKTTKAVRAFLVVNKLLYAAENDLLVGDETGLPAAKLGPDQIRTSGSYARLDTLSEDPALALSPVERAEIEEMFDGFDPDRSGTITAQELEEIMVALGASLTRETMGKIVGVLDEDGNGEIDKEEFLNFYARNIYFCEDKRSTAERALDMFDMFDQGKDGEITIGEFKTALDAFSYGFTVDEVGGLVRELDEDESGTITKHEFEYLLYKFEAQLMPHSPRDLPVV